MTINRNSFNIFKQQLYEDQEIKLAVILVSGLVFGAPILSFILEYISPPLPYPLLVSTALVGGIYGIVAISLRERISGLYVALIVTAMFAANIPLTATANQYPLSLGPQLFLVEIPLVILTGILVIKKPFLWKKMSLPEYLLIGFVFWSGLSAIIGQSGRMDLALYYSLFALAYTLAFVVVSRGISSGLFKFRSAIYTFCLSVLGQVLFAFVQLLNQQAFGLSYLGESVREYTTTLSLSTFVQFKTGLFVNGFTGSSYNLAHLIILIFPILLAFALQQQGRLQKSILTSSIFFAAFVRFSSSDATRGGLLIAILVFVTLYILAAYKGSIDHPEGGRTNRSHKLIQFALAIVTSILVVLFPSNKSGRAIRQPDSGVGSTGSTGSTGSDTTESLSELQQFLDTVSSVSIPFFDLTTMGVRFYQYVVGILIFVDNPLIGIGGANFADVAPAYGLAESRLIHNLYIALLAETGFVGSVLYIGALVAIISKGVNLILERGDLLTMGILAGLLGSLAVSFWTHRLLDVATFSFPFWILAGMIVGKSHRAESNNQPTGSKNEI